MKLGELRSLGHNIAHSLGSGIGLMIGVYEIDIFSEASAGGEGFVSVNFLDGTTFGNPISEATRRAICLYRDALPGLCNKHRVAFSDVRVLTARYGSDQVYGPHFSVHVESTLGQTATDQYVGVSGRWLRRIKI
ncbi:hypothetical protein SCB29_34475 [Paraburkholderia sp. SIMBA_055]